MSVLHTFTVLSVVCLSSSHTQKNNEKKIKSVEHKGLGSAPRDLKQENRRVEERSGDGSLRQSHKSFLEGTGLHWLR